MPFTNQEMDSIDAAAGFSLTYRAQQNAQAAHVQNNINAQQQNCSNNWPDVYWRRREPMTASDLGIVDQNLDDKVGMEP